MTGLEWGALRVSVLVAGAALLLVLPAGTALGWLLARGRFRGKAILEAVIFLPLVLPPVVTGYLLLVLLGPNSWLGGPLRRGLGLEIVFTTKGMILAAAAVGLPLMVRGARVAIEAVEPGLVDAARTLGHGRWSAFRRVTLPLARNGILAGAVLAFARALGEFGATVMVASNLPGTRTLALEVYRQIGEPGTEAIVARLAVLSVLLSLAALLGTEWLARPRRARR
jgi:molybdate transport system permease protein